MFPRLKDNCYRKKTENVERYAAY
uniref:Uncharacterized protein n=1 Tax=Anguilla anguilla TaxID=7936 RepID=A0A0E9TY54_ANGAN